MPAEPAAQVAERQTFRPSQPAVEAQSHFFGGQYEKARKVADRALKTSAGDQGAHAVLTILYAQEGNLRLAVSHALAAPTTRIARLFLDREPSLAGDKLEGALQALTDKRNNGEIDEAGKNELVILTRVASFREKLATDPDLQALILPPAESQSFPPTVPLEPPTNLLETPPTVPVALPQTEPLGSQTEALESTEAFQPLDESSSLAEQLYREGAYTAAIKAAKDALKLNAGDQNAHEILGLIFAREGHFDVAMEHIKRAPDSRIAKIISGQELGLVGNELQQAIDALEAKKADKTIRPNESEELIILTLAAQARAFELQEKIKDLELRWELANKKMYFRLGRQLSEHEKIRMGYEGASHVDVLLEAGIDPYSKPLPYPGESKFVDRVPVSELEANGVNFLPSEKYNEYRSVYDDRGQLYRLIGKEGNTFLVQRLSKKPGEKLVVEPERAIPYEEFIQWRMETADYSTVNKPDSAPEPVTEALSEPAHTRDRVYRSRRGWPWRTHDLMDAIDRVRNDEQLIVDDPKLVTPGKIKRMLEEFNMPAAMIDQQLALARKYNSEHMPYLLVFNTEGGILHNVHSRLYGSTELADFVTENLQESTSTYLPINNPDLLKSILAQMQTATGLPITESEQGVPNPAGVAFERNNDGIHIRLISKEEAEEIPSAIPQLEVNES